MSKLYFYHSVMNSGKSAHIIMQVHNFKQLGYKVSVLKPKVDTRDFGIIKSRALNTIIEADLIDDDVDIYELIKQDNPDYVFVDEVNFLSENSIEELARVVDDLNIPVFSYGLLIDFRGLLFAGSKRMIELSDTIRELKSPCVKCGSKATLHLRKIDGKYIFKGESIQVGDTDLYESVCRGCYIKTKNNL